MIQLRGVVAGGAWLVFLDWCGRAVVASVVAQVAVVIADPVAVDLCSIDMAGCGGDVFAWGLKWWRPWPRWWRLWCLLTSRDGAWVVLLC